MGGLIPATALTFPTRPPKLVGRRWLLNLAVTDRYNRYNSELYYAIKLYYQYDLLYYLFYIMPYTTCILYTDSQAV